MTIEIAPKSPSAAPVKPAEGSARQKSTDKTDSGSDSASNAKSFLAVLAGAEDAAAPWVADSTMGLTPDSKDGPITDWLVAADSTLSLGKPLDASSGALSDLSVLVAQSAVVPIPVPDVTAAAEAGRGKSVAGKDGALPLQAALDTALGKPSNTPQAKSGKAVLDAAAQAAQPVLADASGVSAGASAVSASKEATPERIHKFMQELTATLAKAPETSTVAWGSSRERAQEPLSNPRVPTNEVSAQNWVAPQGAGGAMGVDGVVAGAATAHADRQAAEQVSYWIGQDVQKAEMTLDGLGANPVEVSISMQGKEATVVFRSDEALTRDALSNASTQLQDAMSRQGVVLSGVSVGTSNSGDSQRQGSGGKPPGWKVGTVEASADPVASAPRQGPSGRSIDLFV